MKSNTHTARRLPLAALAACVLLFSGCTTVPKNGALLSAKVTEGIQRNQSETEKIITALADTQRAILDEKWDDLYVQVEQAWLEKNGVADASTLTQDQRSSISANMSVVWENLSSQIDAKEAELIAQSRENTATLIEMNEAIQRYLLSVENLEEARGAVASKITEITGVDLSSIGTLADKLLENFNP